MEKRTKRTKKNDDAIGEKQPMLGKKNFHMEFKNISQKMAYSAFEQHDVLFLLGPAGTGKTYLACAFAIGEIIGKKKKRITITRPIVEAGESLGFLPGPQPLDAKVLTPTGWTTMGSLEIGDEVMSRDGKSTKILAVYPKGNKPVYRVETTDGTSTECCLDHLWLTSDRRGRKTGIKSTQQIMDSLVDIAGKPNHFLPRNGVVEYRESTSLPIPPYTIGVLLGDGHLGNAVSFACNDVEIADKVRREVAEIGITLKTYASAGTCRARCCNGSIVAGERYRFAAPLDRRSNSVKVSLDRVGLLGRRAWDKFVPAIYKYGSAKDRLAVLRGLMDTDGKVTKRGEAVFFTTSPSLSQDVAEIVRSLGGRVRARKPREAVLGGRRIVSKRTQYELTVSLPTAMNPFSLTRKADRFSCNYIRRVGIARITPVGEKEVRCILVDNPEHLYLTDDFIVTHNTLEEKVNPYMLPIYDCIGKLVGYEGPERDRIDRCIEKAPLAYLRGRAQPLHASVLTPKGFVQMGDVKVGDQVVGSDGKPSRIIGVFPQGRKEVFRVNFSDGSKTECCGEHLWLTQSLSEKRHNRGYSVKQTSEIAVKAVSRFGQKLHKIPLVNPVAFESTEVPIDPYLLGLLLGDGHVRRGAIKFTTADAELLNEVARRMPPNMKIDYSRKYDFNLVGKVPNKNPLLKQFNELGLVGKKPPDKFVPDVYKYNTPTVRLELLRGLLDTGGWIGNSKGTHRIQFSSTSLQLAKDVQFLVQSLGGVAPMRTRDHGEESHLHNGRVTRHCRCSYVLEIMLSNFNPFRLSRKSRRYQSSAPPIRLISSIEPCGEKECQCIQVDAEDHLYVTDDFILTHNTLDHTVAIFDEAQNASMMQLKLFLTRMGENCKIIVTGDPMQSDLKGGVALLEVVKLLESEPGIGIVEFKANSIVRHPLVGRILERLEGRG